MFNWIKNALRYKRDEVGTVKRGFTYTAGVNVYEDSAMKVSAYYRGVIYISTQISKLPWEIKNRKNVVQENNPIQYLLDVSPNNEMTAMDFKLCMIQNAIHHGNAYAEIERNTLGRPVAIWPIPSENVEPHRLRNGKLIYRIIGGSNTTPGNDVYLDPKDIYHLKNFHTKDGLVGQGLLAYASESLGISLGADRMAGGLFANGGLPSGVVEVPGQLSDEAFKRIKDSWKENYGGRKAGGVAILEEGMKFSSIMMSPDLLQFLESRKFGVVEIARFLGLPPTKLFDTEASTFNNMENANLEVATDTLDAWARRMETEADMKMLNGQYAGLRTEMDLYAIFRGDMTTRSNYFSKMMQTASITPNEIRIKEGLAPYEGGNRYYVAVNNYSPADRIDEIVDAQIKKSEGSNQAKDATPPDSSKDPNTTQANSQLVEAATKFLMGV